MRGVILVLAVFLFPLGALAEPELVVERALWAFTGKPIPGAFNILTVEVRNVSDEPYQGSIPLAKASVAVPEMQQIGIAPGGGSVACSSLLMSMRMVAAFIPGA
jgi:hypothetical protein